MKYLDLVMKYSDVVCINNNGWDKFLTTGKTYKILNVEYIDDVGYYVLIKDDKEFETIFPDRIFRFISREDKLKRILKDV